MKMQGNRKLNEISTKSMDSDSADPQPLWLEKWKRRKRNTHITMALVFVGVFVFVGAMTALVLVKSGSFENGRSESSQSSTSQTQDIESRGNVESSNGAVIENTETIGDATQSSPPLQESSASYINDTVNRSPTPLPSLLPPSQEPSDSYVNNTLTQSPTSMPSSTRIPMVSSIESSFPSSPNSVKEKEEVFTGETIFYATGDIPYDSKQIVILQEQMSNVPSDAEFIIHVGDMRAAGDNVPCERYQFEEVSDIMRLSHAPVFMIIGDNDWTDCPNMEEGLALWEEYFVGFEGRYWNHTFDIQRHPDWPQNFAFEHKGTLFIGLLIVGGKRRDADEWHTRLSSQSAWMKELITEYVEGLPSDIVGRVVIFGHAHLVHTHRPIQYGFDDIVATNMNNNAPMLYLNGDLHEWGYDVDYLGVTNLLRIMVSGLGVDPLLKVTVTADGMFTDASRAFQYDRML